MYIPEEPCVEIKCPGPFENGKWVNCNFLIGTSCNYTCNYGYTKNDAVARAECQINGNWKLANTDSLCKPNTCPKEFHQGRIENTCERTIGQRCDYQCTGYGYKKNENISRLECMQSGTWNSDTDSLCQQITCPKGIPNGALLKDSKGQQCSTAVGTRCGFACNNGFVKASTVDSLHCLLDGWAHDLQTLCTVPRCPEIIHLIRVSTDCQRVNGSKCFYTCKNGYKKRPGMDKVVCNGEIYTPEDPCEAITCSKVFNQGIISRTCAGMIGQQCDYECMGYGYKKNESIPTIDCMASGMWNKDTDSLCQLEPAMSAGFHIDVHPAAIAVGVVFGVSIIIVITLIILKRKSIMSKFAMTKMEEEVISGPEMQMSTSFGANDDGAYFHADYNNFIDNKTVPTNREEPNGMSLPPKYNSMETSTKHDSAMAIPRSRTNDNQLNKKH